MTLEKTTAIMLGAAIIAGVFINIPSKKEQEIKAVKKKKELEVLLDAVVFGPLTEAQEKRLHEREKLFDSIFNT